MRVLPDWSSALAPTGLVAIMLITCGCGYVDYELRLNESRKYYAFLDKVEQFLLPKWVSSEAPLEVRVPKMTPQFIPMAPPQKITREDGSVEEPAVDPRQPDYVDLVFPELVGAWETRFPVIKSDGTHDDRRGYLYALTNYWQLSSELAADSTKFVTALKLQMAEKLGVPVSDERQELQPIGYPAYVPHVNYDVFSFKKIDVDGVFYNFDVYAKQHGSVIGVLVLVLPEGMESPQKLNERLPLMLGYFNFSPDPPRAGGNRNAPAGSTPAAPAGF